MKRLEGRVALVTGTGHGPGRAAALRFAAEGALVVGGDLDEAQAAETQRLIARDGGIALNPCKLDVTDQASVHTWVTEAVAAFGAIDVLYAGAESSRHGDIEFQSYEDYVLTVRNQLDAVWLCARAVWPHMTLGRASIVTVGSATALTGSATRGMGAHAAAAGGIVALSRQLAAEGAAFGIRVNCISPGVIDDAPAPTGTPNSPPAVEEYSIPLGRAGSPDDVAQAALFLSSDEASYITGAQLVVDGGWSAARPG
ncbi:SDR family NAD(P)-dependent oxidoreductase [Streptomyces sp. NPDC060011]|uniref:SDR family NAD(P)-dependent oxidoreductase n=1 Tax=unclassified Streptomyces TaxID=2593676 RepID=UPI0022592850|nr:MULTISPECIES: SDR family NAD(P)-dependent oxidoreductase [unclassified Streptomyces]MCX5137419.1 SDR family oxidoreductase [Streptomyces sp. NBC_00340]WSD81214.1 SDR family oxidoreductase [Streptomyces sp. NBC_01558]WSK64812.1 SDR family oxidoreductase [Streptomyces sp. NBC_01281]